MSLRNKLKVADGFSMASMTDVIFLLLIFFLISSTMVMPNVIKVTLPSASSEQSMEAQKHVRIIITESGVYYLGIDKAEEEPSSLEQIAQTLQAYSAKHPEAYVSIHAHESVPYQTVVSAISLASESRLRVVLATKAESGNQQ